MPAFQSLLTECDGDLNLFFKRVGHLKLKILN